MTGARRPDLRHERALLRAGAQVVVGMDEVGRGALAGPVTVGAVAVDLTTRTCPRGVADSKLLTPAARQRLLPALGRWGLARGVGHAGPEEIDRVGIIGALRLAGRRALDQLGAGDLVLLDGSHDWLSTPDQGDLLEEDGDAARPDVVVRTRVKADLRCASVAAASVLAKCERDAIMVALAAEHPEYGWAENKGYGSVEHVEALRRVGPCALHRRSWRLPVAGDPTAGAVAVADGERGLEVAGPRGLVDLVEADPDRGPGPGQDVRWVMMDA